MTSENLSDGQPAFVRFLLLLVGEAVAGVFLYAVFTFMPLAVQMIVTLTSWVVIANDNIFHPKKNKSLGSLLCGITAIPVVYCGIAWRMTHEDVWSRLMLVGACLMAALIFLDRRADASDYPSQRTLRISAAGSRFAHASKAPQVKPRWADGTWVRS